jgi:hypothetical protein
MRTVLSQLSLSTDFQERAAYACARLRRAVATAPSLTRPHLLAACVEQLATANLQTSRLVLLWKKTTRDGLHLLCGDQNLNLKWSWSTTTECPTILQQQPLQTSARHDEQSVDGKRHLFDVLRSTHSCTVTLSMFELRTYHLTSTNVHQKGTQDQTHAGASLYTRSQQQHQ